MEHRKRLLIIGKVWPEPASSAAGSRMTELISLFNRAGYEITFCTSAANSEHAADLSSLGVRVERVRLNHSSFDRFVRELDPDMVLFDRFMTEEQFGWRVRSECPNAVRILDTEDLHFLRAAREKAWRQNREWLPGDLMNEETALREIASIYRCDLSLIISEAEIKILTQQFGIDRSLLFYLPFLLDEEEGHSPDFENREGFVSIGNFLHEPNWNAVLWLKQEIWPLIRRELPDARLHLYGAYPSQKVYQLHNPEEGFLVHGRAGSAAEVLQRSRVLLAPLRFGAGLKGKLVDAMRNGTPNVTTAIGAEGIQGEGVWSGFVADDPAGFAHASVRLHSDRSEWERSRDRGFEILKQRFMRSEFEGPFLRMVNQMRNRLEEHRKGNFTGRMLMHHTMQSSRYLSKWIEEKNR